MKMRKLFSFLLALLTALAAVLPARAAEGNVQAQDPASVPEESPAENETAPGWLLEPEDGETEPPADTTAPEDPIVPETPVIPETPENPEVPGEILPPAEPETPENPDTPEVPVVPEEPETPETPVIPEAPENPETPSQPETPVNPGDPSQPPAWLLPPEETPSLPAAPGMDDPALLPPENAAAEEPPVINVLVPSTGQIVINPYRLPVELDGQTSNDQIVSEQLILQNLSVVPVSVSASVTGTVPPGSGVSFAAVPPAPDSPVKEIYLFAEFQPLSDLFFQPAWNGQYSEDSANQLLVSSWSTRKDNVLRLEASGAAYSFGAMRLFGSAAVSPMVPWQAGDDIQASFVFSFTPVVEVSDVPAMDETPVTETPAAELPAVDAPVTDVPAVDIPVPAEPASIPEPVPDSLPGWLLES